MYANSTNELLHQPSSAKNHSASSNEVTTNKISRTPSLLKTMAMTKAKRVRFFCNGDKFYAGMVIAVTPAKYKTFDVLLTDLTTMLSSKVSLPTGVRIIYDMDGKKLTSIEELENDERYVCAGRREPFRKVQYGVINISNGIASPQKPWSPKTKSRPKSSIPALKEAQIIVLIQHSMKQPREVSTVLLNKSNAPNLEQAFIVISQAVKLDSGNVQNVYTLSGSHVCAVEQFFGNDDVFVAFETDKSSQKDLQLSVEELKAVKKKKGGKFERKDLEEVPLPFPLEKNFTAGKILGSGSFSVVRYGFGRNNESEHAIKIVNKYKCRGLEDQMEKEVRILRQLHHPNIIRLAADLDTTDHIFIITDLVKGGELGDILYEIGELSEADSKVLMRHLISAIAYLHSQCIIHHDIKPQNLLIEMAGNQAKSLKLADLGLARIVPDSELLFEEWWLGISPYIAPEVIEITGYGFKIDVWAAGVIMYFMLCGSEPFDCDESGNEDCQRNLILAGNVKFEAPTWNHVSEAAKQLISNMIRIDPGLRFSAEAALADPWIMGAVNRNTISRYPSLNLCHTNWFLYSRTFEETSKPLQQLQIRRSSTNVCGSNNEISDIPLSI